MTEPVTFVVNSPQFTISTEASPERFKFVEFGVAVQLDDPLTQEEIDDLGEGIMTVACGGCEVCGGPNHCDDPDHSCKRLVVMGQQTVSVDAPDEELCTEPLGCELLALHEGPHQATSRLVPIGRHDG